VIAGVGLIASVVTYKTELSNICSVQQLDLVGEIKKYDDTKDAQFCDALNAKISKFNDACKSNIDELDCG
jgi:hypothetical protein